ncbi:MAG: hypothetical protein V3T70_03880, partial [Phycisphaerae bacterium]
LVGSHEAVQFDYSAPAKCGLVLWKETTLQRDTLRRLKNAPGWQLWAISTTEMPRTCPSSRLQSVARGTFDERSVQKVRVGAKALIEEARLKWIFVNKS